MHEDRTCVGIFNLLYSGLLYPQSTIFQSCSDRAIASWAIKIIIMIDFIFRGLHI